MNLPSGVAALLCMAVPAMALDANPKSFRADPQAWVRNNVLPQCIDPISLNVWGCNCQVKAIASRLSEADVVSVNKPGWHEVMRSKVDLHTILFLCSKGQTPN